MKKFLLIPCVLLSILVLNVLAQKNIKPSVPLKLKVYYFHPDERCPIDQSVEENTKKVMAANFQEKIRNGTIEFSVINTDDKSNAKLVSGFDINAQALYIVKVENGKEKKNDLTKFAFDFGLSNPLKFKKGLKDEIEKNLK